MDGCWKILENSVKWQEVVPEGRKASGSEMPTDSSPQSPEESQIPSTFPSVDMDNTPSSGGSGSVSSPSKKRPAGRKQAKEKRSKNKLEEQSDVKFLNLMEQFNQSVIDKATTKAELQAQRVAIEERKIALEEKKAARKEKEMEDRVMQMDLNMIEDLQLRAYYQHRKDEIMAKLTASTTSYYSDLPPF